MTRTVTAPTATSSPSVSGSNSYSGSARMDRDACTLLERELAVAGDVVGVVVRLEHAHDPQPAAFGDGDQLLDRVRRVDDDRLAGVLVADQIRGAAQRLVENLLENHRGRVYGRSWLAFLK